MKTTFKFIFTLLSLFTFATNQTYIHIEITDQTDPIALKTIGQKGTFGLMTNIENLNSIFNPTEIETPTNFKGNFVSQSNKTYLWNCRLWDPANMNVVVLCTIDDTISREERKNFALTYGEIRKGNDYIIKINGANHNFDIDLKSCNIPFIYSDPQFIDLDSENDSFELKFKVDSYFDEKLFLVDKTKLEALTDLEIIRLDKNELVCNISRKKIEEMLTNSKTLSVAYSSKELGLFIFPLCGDIKIKYSKSKADINVMINEVIITNYQNVLDFTQKENYTLEYFMNKPENFNKIKFIEDAPDLLCKNEKFKKICVVSKSHFNGHQSGNYYTIYSNNTQSSYIAYDERPFKVILDKNIYINISSNNNQDTKIFGKSFYDKKTGKDIYYPISLVTDYNDTQRNIFNILDIEETHFDMKFQLEGDTNNYTANCRLWKPLNDFIRLFCTTGTIDGRIKFAKTSFNYSGYTVIIEVDDYINTKYYQEPISFLYSDKHYIDLYDEDTFTLKFKYDIYYNEGFYLLNGDNYIPLKDECQIEEGKKEITCQIDKDIIEENLINEGDFKLWMFNDYFGSLRLDTIFDINIQSHTTSNKETIKVTIEDAEQFYSKRGENVAYKTNSSLTPSITTDKFYLKFIDPNDNIKEYSCYLKSQKEKKYINLLCCITNTGNFYLYPQSLELNNIHYRYNFLLTKSSIDSRYIRVSEKGTRVLLTYPPYADLTSKNNITLKYVMDEPSNEANIAISQRTYASGSDLINCKNQGKVKSCEIPINFFLGKKTGYFYTYHINSQNSYVPYYDSAPFYFIIHNNNKYINITIRTVSSSYVGKNGIIDLVTDYNDTLNIFKEKDKLEEFNFKTTFSVYNNLQYDVTCRLWNPTNEYLRIFCQLHQDLEYYYDYIFNSVSFYYNGYEILINSKENIWIRESNDYEYPFLYAEKQTINLDDGKDTYELKFKFLIYNNDFIFLQKESDNNFVLDNCKVQGKELICLIKKNQLEENLPSLGVYRLQIFFKYYPYQFEFESVLDINIKYSKPIVKENVDVNIIGLLSNQYNNSVVVAFETDVYSVPDLITEKTRSIDFIGGSLYCYFRKNYPNNLLLLCYTEYSYSDIYEYYGDAIYLSNIHYKYNFNIMPSNPISFSISEPFIAFNTYPSYIDLIANDSASLKFFTSMYPRNPIRLNLDGEDLDCRNYRRIEECILPASHFKNKTSGYYYTYYKNNYGDWQIMYDANPIYVNILKNNSLNLAIKKEYNKNNIKVGIKGTLYFKTDYNDNENSIFDYESEKKVNFSTNIFDDQGNNYKVICRIWKQNNGVISIFCDLNETLKFKEQNIYFNNTKFYYENTLCIITSDDYLKVNQLDCNMSFIYANPQIINFEYNKYGNHEYFSFKFMLGSYYKNEKLFLQGENYNSILCEKIYHNENELSCSMSKSTLQQLLTVNNETFKLFAINENYGTYSFDNVLDINLNCIINGKETININYIKLINSVSEINSVFAYETNITNVDSFMTIKWGNNRFIKRDNEPLMILSESNEAKNFSFGKISEPIVLDNVHYKYNIIFGPLENNEIVYISEFGTQIRLVDKEFLDLYDPEHSEVYFVMDNPHLLNNLKLNPDSNEELECINYIGMKKCKITPEHFKGKNSNYYYLHHSNHLKKTSIDLSSNPIYVSKDDNIIIRIKLEDNKDTILIGKNGVFGFITNYNDNERNVFDISDIEESTAFNTSIYDQNNDKFSVTCRLWKPMNEKIRIFCKLNETLNTKISQITLDSVKFNYKNYNVYIFSSESLKANRFDSNIPLLYCDKQEINIQEGIENYEFKFKIESYNHEILYLYHDKSYIVLDNCFMRNENKELMCEINKDKLEETLVITKAAKFKLSSFNDYSGEVPFNSVLDITINYVVTEKKDIFVSITKLLNYVSESNVAVAFETNITSIPNLQTDVFEIQFNNFYEIINVSCYFKKNNKDTMLLLCNIIDEGFYYIEKPENIIILKEINYRYNFIISPIEINDAIEILDLGSDILLTYPNVLNFILNQELTIRFRMSSGNLANDIKLNPNSDSSLDCINIGQIKTCTVPISRFNNRTTDYFYTYYSNHLNQPSIYYSSTPCKIIFPDEYAIVIQIKHEFNKEAKHIGLRGTLDFITDYNDNEKNIFNPSDIEEKTKYETKAVDREGNKYNLVCFLWKPLNDYLRLFCNLKDDSVFKDYNQYISLNNIEFKYNKYTFLINFENDFEVYQYNYTIPFIYSDIQEINIKQNMDIIQFKFKAELYKNEVLYITNKKLSYIPLEHCYLDKKDLICSINKDIIEENLVLDKDNTLYYLGDFNLGSRIFSNVYDIKIIYESPQQKTDIFLGINNLLTNNAFPNGVIAYNTNYNGIVSNLITDTFEMKFNINDGYDNTFVSSCYLKKTEGQNILLLCIIDFYSEYKISLAKITEKIVLTDINFKYNFIIIPVDNKDLINLERTPSSQVQMIYPTLLDFTLEEEYSINYIMTYPSNIASIKLNPDDSNPLKCTNNNLLKTCYVPKTHFIGKNDGYYSTIFNSTYILYDASPIQVISPPDDGIVLTIKTLYNEKGIIIGNEGTLYFVIDYSDIEKDIFDELNLEEKTSFNTTIKDLEQNKYNIQCHFWKQDNNKILLLCDLKEKLKYEKQNMILTKTSFIYNKHTVIIYQKDYINVTKLISNIAFLYSHEQTINIEDGKEFYDIIFKFSSYYNDVLYLYGDLYNYQILNNCEINMKELVCRIAKDKLEEILINPKTNFKLGSMNDYYGVINFDFVANINIEYSKYIDGKNKEDIFLTFTRIADPYSEVGTAFAIETNVSNIQNINTKEFGICHFKKASINPLFVLCMPDHEGNYDINKLIEQKIYDDIHYKYNFRIQPFDLDEEVLVNKKGTNILLTYPDKLDLISQNNLIIRYIMPLPSLAKNIKLNPDSEFDLECEDLLGLKKCIIPLDHFDGKKSGYYNTYHINHLGEYSIYYDANPINIILPQTKKKIQIAIEDKDNKNNLKIGQKGIIYLVTNYNDTQNLFDSTQLEQYTFHGYFSDPNSNQKYESICRLWKPEKENLRLICQLKENLKNKEQKIYLDKINFIYSDFNITINYYAENINYNQLDSEISFLYSDKQKILIENDKSTYTLIFRQLYYDNGPLYLYKNDMKSIKLNNCEKVKNELLCYIKKEEILGILSYSGESYNLAEKVDSQGLYIFNSVLDVKFNYNIEQNEIKVKIGSLLTKNLAKNEFIAFKTNIEKISELTSDYFDLDTIKNEKIKCLFKKNNGQDNLLLLCNATNDGINKLGKINSITLENINIFNKFIIEESENNEEFYISNTGTKITALYPLELDFSKSDSYKITYETKFPDRLNGIKLNAESDSILECTNFTWYKECLVNKTHFSKSGYYNTYHINHLGTNTISYEAPVIKVNFEEEIKPDPSKDEGDGDGEGKNHGLAIGLSVTAGVIVLAGVAFFVWYYLKIKGKIDNKKNNENIELVEKDKLISSDIK